MPHIPKCDQCESVYINGIYCHEHGCPNSKKIYDEEENAWVSQVDEEE
jgi:hypothetical protein